MISYITVNQLSLLFNFDFIFATKYSQIISVVVYTEGLEGRFSRV